MIYNNIKVNLKHTYIDLCSISSRISHAKLISVPEFVSLVYAAIYFVKDNLINLQE